MSSWIQNRVGAGLGVVTSQACHHPLYTMVVTAIIAAMTYSHVLGESYGVVSTGTWPASMEMQTFLSRSRRLRLGEDTSWKWHADDDCHMDEVDVSLGPSKT